MPVRFPAQGTGDHFTNFRKRRSKATFPNVPLIERTPPRGIN